MNWQPFIDFLAAQGPAILILVYSYMNGQKIRAEQALKTDELQKAIAEAHAKIDASFAGKSNADVISSIVGPAQP